jgi:hypothetical protein
MPLKGAEKKEASGKLWKQEKKALKQQERPYTS